MSWTYDGYTNNEYFADIKNKDLRKLTPFFTEAHKKITNNTKYVRTYFKDGTPPNPKPIQYAEIKSGQFGSYAADWIEEIHVLGNKEDMSVNGLLIVFDDEFMTVKYLPLNRQYWDTQEKKWILNAYAKPGAFFNFAKEKIKILNDLRSIQLPNGYIIHDVYYIPGIQDAPYYLILEAGYWDRIAEQDAPVTHWGDRENMYITNTDIFFKSLVDLGIIPKKEK